MEPILHPVNDKLSEIEGLAKQPGAWKRGQNYFEEKHVRLVQRNLRSPAFNDELLIEPHRRMVARSRQFCECLGLLPLFCGTGSSSVAANGTILASVEQLAGNRVIE